MVEENGDVDAVARDVFDVTVFHEDFEFAKAEEFFFEEVDEFVFDFVGDGDHVVVEDFVDFFVEVFLTADVFDFMGFEGLGGEGGFEEGEDAVFFVGELDFDEYVAFVEGVLFADDLDVGVGLVKGVEVDFFDGAGCVAELVECLFFKLEGDLFVLELSVGCEVAEFVGFFL